jgi:type IV secretory pathway TrbD component
MALFTGQSVGVLLAAALMASIGSAWVIALSGAAMFVMGWAFAQALKRRDAFMHLE